MIDDTDDRQPDALQAPADEKTGFGEAFRERIASDGGDKGASDETREAPEGPKPEGTESKGEGEQPDPAARTAEEAAPAKEAPAAPPAKADPWEGLTPEQRERVTKLQASERSQRGRVGALTKKLLKSSAPTAPNKDNQQQPPAEGGDAPAGETSDEKLERLEAAARDYPESIGPAAEIIRELRTEIEGLKASSSKAQEDADAAEIAEAYDDLAKAHGDYAELAGDQDFLAWVGDQPESVVALANSWNPREVSLVLTLFKAEKAASMPRTAEPAAEAQAEAKGESETDARRRRQLEGSRDTPSRGAPAAAGVPDDFGSAFKARLAQRQREDEAP